MENQKVISPDSAQDVLRYERKPLNAIFSPKNVALIGATEKAGTVGRTLLWNLISSPFGGTVYPINPNRPSVLGIRAYSSVRAVPERVDLAVICTPAQTVPGIIDECAKAGVKGVIIISAGFKETGPVGEELEKQVLERAQQARMRVVGPNCLGVMNPVSGLNATFASGIAESGSVGFISQSGALCTAVLDWSFREHVGFSAFVSIGSMLDVGWGDLIYYLGDDPQTKSIIIYMETIGDARSFLTAAREVALTKPIIVIKPGRTAGAARAAASHTGSLTGSDEVLDAAFHRCGVLRVNNISELFYMSEILAKQPRPRGPRLTILTNAGGPGVLATDALITSGGELTELAAPTMAALNQLLPSAWSHNDPIDILGDASPERYAKAMELALKDPGSDGLLVVLTPQAMTEPTRTAEALKEHAREKFEKPVMASWMGGDEVAQGVRILSEADIPTFPYPDTAARMFCYMYRYTENLRGLYETPSLPSGGELDAPDRSVAADIIGKARESGRTLLTEFESKQVLTAYGIPTVKTSVATNEDEAVNLAKEIGFPVVLKLHSKTITHKTDVGGVRLNLGDAAAVRVAFRGIAETVGARVGPQHFQGVTVQPMVRVEGYELILGSSLDPQFGPVLLFGMGGQLVEVFKDRALGLPPLTTTLARRMMEQTKIYEALKGVRGREAVDLSALEDLMVRFSQLVVEQQWIKEIDLNPILAASDRLLALDARVVLHDRSTKLSDLPKLAIRPYPVRYVQPWTMKDGTTLVIRPIRPEDEPLMVRFHETLSARSVYLRYFQTLDLSRRVEHERLTRICFTDYDREMALVADLKNPEISEHEIIGVGRLSKLHGADEAEFAILVSDRFQHSGLGTELLRRLLDVAGNEGVARVSAYMLVENSGMRRVSEKLGFELTYDEDKQLVRAEIDLKRVPKPSARDERTPEGSPQVAPAK